jgi:K+-sensing histidine kinase KdpD
MAEATGAGAPDPLRALTHDLRSPLTIVEMLAGVLERDDGSLTPEERRDHARRIREAAAEARALVDAV